MRTSVMLFASAAAFTLAARRPGGVDPSGLHYGFGECVDNERTLYYYRDNFTTCALAEADAFDPQHANASSSPILYKPPVKGLACDLPCDKGYFLGADFSGPIPVSACEKCPTGTFSLGGGQLFSRLTNAWTDPLPVSIYTDCVTRNIDTNQWQSNCNPWIATMDGASIASGDNSDILDRYNAARLFSTLRISATFVRPGSVTYQFYVDAEEPYDGLVFDIDEKAMTPVISKTDGWTEATFQVEAGSHTFSWEFTKDFSGDDGDDRAYIKVIEFVGTSYADTFCHACGTDVTMDNGGLCAFCPENQYAAPYSDSEVQFGCFDCPMGLFAPKGSIGQDACMQRRACTTDDLVEIVGPCVRNYRNISYEWNEPRTCDASMKQSITVPPPALVRCDQCDRGYVLEAVNDTCVPCPIGMYQRNNSCVECPIGQVVVKEQVYGADTVFGWSQWPTMIDVPAALDAGWTLTKNALALLPQRSKSARLRGPKRFPVLFNVTFATSGYVNLTYELSNVPTMETDGARAWLELEVQDRKMIKDKMVNDEKLLDVPGDLNGGEDEAVTSDLIHLKHGGENGTFTEVLYVNVTKTVTKQFSLIVRTTDTAAERKIQAKVLQLAFHGTESGGSIGCSACAPGFRPVANENNEYSCQACPAGTFSQQIQGTTAIECVSCPANMFSKAGSSECVACGNNSISTQGSTFCAVPVDVNVHYEMVGTDMEVQYNLSLLQTLVWGNESLATNELNAKNGSMTVLSTETIIPSQYYTLDDDHAVFVGVFRPVNEAWRDQVYGPIIDQDASAADALPYMIEMKIMNPKDAGGYFTQESGRYGIVQCSVPPQWKIMNRGSKIDIKPFHNGTGVQVEYSDGSYCEGSGGRASSRINFICDPTAGLMTSPTFVDRNDQACTLTLEWKTSFACPVCTADYYKELRTECSAGQQSISYTTAKACYGGFQPDAVPIATCSDIVLHQQEIFKVYAALSVVAFVVLVLFIAVLITYRKYKNAYNDYLYLKAKIPNVTTHGDGSKETTFEFGNAATGIDASPAATSKALGLQESPLSPDPHFQDETKTLRSV